MNAEVIPWPGKAVRSPIGHFIRLGDTAHRLLQDLYAEGRLPLEAVIVDSSVAFSQRAFIQALRENGVEVILDTKVAELSEIGKYKGSAARAPWARVERPLEKRDFELGSSTSIFDEIARFAVSLGVSSILTPTHFLRKGVDDPWLSVDVEGVSVLREALDREGGEEIALDYTLILPHVRLSSIEDSLVSLERLCDLPIDNLFLRLSGFGIDSGPFTVKRTFQNIVSLHALGLPLLLDYVGGLVGVGSVALGTVCGIAHGIGERERFDARDWNRLPRLRKPGEGGRAVLLPVSGLDRSFRKKDFELIVNARGGRRLVSCGDRECCPQGLTSMVANPRAHRAHQRLSAMKHLAKVPDARRAKHFVEVDVQVAERHARDLSRLKTGNASVDKALAKSGNHVEKMSRMYETMADDNRPTPLPVILRRQTTETQGIEREL